jgi:hypothetical protein
MEFQKFIRSWLTKASNIELSYELNTYYDRFFTLYVVYNRLYAEATFILARNNQLNLSGVKSFPDKKGAINYVSQFLGSENIIRELESDPTVFKALKSIEEMIDRNDFSIKLHMVTGAKQREKDLELLASLRSTNRRIKAEAILGMIYSIRCNMFHGHKGFNSIQTRLLAPVLDILNKVIILLQQKIENGWTPQ